MSSNYFRNDEENENVDVHELFVYYSNFFFEGVLEKCSVEWSEKMTLCAGSCANTYHQSCVIKLSAPILKFRTANEIKQTLLHEMIHAFLFLTNPRACLTQGGHGQQFKTIMKQINEITGLNITVYHNFHDEVDLYRKHIWRCDGVCMMRPPHFGYVKRSMNRKPQPADHWFKEHQRTCGGTFTKLSGPEELPKTKKTSKQKKNRTSWGAGKSIEDYFKQMEVKNGSKKKQTKKQKNLLDYMGQMKPLSKSSSVFQQGKGKSLSQYCQQMKSESTNQFKTESFHMKDEKQ